MSNMPYANPIQGNLTIGNSLIIYDGGYYSLDGGSTVSSDTIGPDTLITAPSAVSYTHLTLPTIRLV